jgi:hypothetical protein
MRSTKLALSDWALVVRFDDGSAATLLGSAGPPELRAWNSDGDAPRPASKRRGLLAAALGGRAGGRKPNHHRV